MGVIKSKMAIFHSSGEKLEFRETNIPPLNRGQILVRNEFTTLCRSDLNTYSGKRKEKTPTILGHEIVGRIESFGAGAKITDERGNELRIGDRVTWAIFSSEPECELSKKGIPQKGNKLFKYGHEALTETNTLHGGLSEYTILRRHTPIVKIDTGIPVKMAAVINCAVSTAAGAIRLAGEINNKNILVYGAGMLGVVACSMCKTWGAKQVVAVDPDDTRRDMAQLFGAHHVLKPFNEGKDEPDKQVSNSYFDVSLEFSGNARAMEESVEKLAIGGTAVWVGGTFPQPKIQIDPEKVIRNLLTFKGLHNYNHQDLVTAVTFIENHHRKFPFESLIHVHFSLEQVNEAFEYAINKNPYRVGISF